MHKLFSLLFLLCLTFVEAQVPEKLNSAEIHHEIEKLNFLGSVLYIGAHPDDENTRLISYFANHKNARTAYLSLTRGDGGQNLIGLELREQLGLIRTQELLAARGVDGGEQFFTRANDFGFSKNPDETLQIWDKEKVLSDVVRTIRKFRPDVIINRFDHRSPGSTHGHHTSSAMLSLEAFELADKNDAFPDQLKTYETFKPKRVFFNTSYWFYGGREEFEKADKSEMLDLEVGTYFPKLGLSNPEIAALSRSQHQSQGFGSTGSRGQATEYLELLKGEMPENDVFEGIDTSWNRIDGGAEIGKILEKVEKEFNFNNPAERLPELIEAYSLIQNLDNDYWRELKTRQIKSIISACAGLYLEASAKNPSAVPGEEIGVNLEAINRSDFPVRLQSVSLQPNNSEINPEITLKNNIDWEESISLKIPETAPVSSPYWLEEETDNGMYIVKNPALIGLPENPASTQAKFIIDFDGTELEFEKPLVYKYNDAVYGETYRPFMIIPEVSVAFEEDIKIFENKNPRQVSVKLESGKASVQGELSLEAPEGWKIKPENSSFNLRQKGSTVRLNFEITPPENQDEIYLKPVAKVNGKEYSDELIKIEYEHIPQQNLVLPAKLKLARLQIDKKGEQIGYIKGAGDAVPESLEQIGYRVSTISPSRISAAGLKRFDAVVLGIRAYNTVEELQYRHKALLDYVENGGTLILQYNTTGGLLIDELGPYPLKLSRDRVTDETSEVRFLSKEHPVLNFPNKITESDFENWVQERGLYFPDQWSEEFTPILSMNDKDESPKNGSLLVAKHGEGYFIYTGLSFFRQFPAGVPGAYRLFANMISIGKE